MSYEVVVIGGGINGLCAALRLAKAGRKVLIVERASQVGGLARAEEFHPGFWSPGILHDSSLIRPSLVEEFGLNQFGLKFRDQAPDLFMPDMDGTGLNLAHDPASARAEIERQMPQDADAYQDFRDFVQRVSPVIRDLLENPPIQVQPNGMAGYWSLFQKGLALRRLGAGDIYELARVGPMCIADWMNERFDSPLLKAILAHFGIEGAFCGPWSPGTAINTLLREAAAGPGLVGGPANLVHALEQACHQAGVKILTGCAVESLELEHGSIKGLRAQGDLIHTRQVLATCSLKHLFLDLLPETALPLELEDWVNRWRIRGDTAKIHLALNGPLQFAGRPKEFAPVRVITGADLDEQERAFDAVKYSEASQQPLLDLYLPAAEGTVEGKSAQQVGSLLVRFVPQAGWNETTRAALLENVLNELQRYAPNLRESLVASQLMTPTDLEEHYGVAGGHLFHGEHALDQLMFLRPHMDFARYQTPFSGLYLGGGSSHPGGGITGLPGLLAARTMMSS